MSLILIHIYPTVLLRSFTNASTFVPLPTPLLICNGLRCRQLPYHAVAEYTRCVHAGR